MRRPRTRWRPRAWAAALACVCACGSNDSDEGSASEGSTATGTGPATSTTATATASTSSTATSTTNQATTSTVTMTTTSPSSTGADETSAGTTVGGDEAMTFFVTSQGSGSSGGNLGGLGGADTRCQSLADAAGAGDRTWRAYLSQAATGGDPQVDARDRIGSGPWHNAAGELVASDVASLHTSGIDPSRMLDENGDGAAKGRPPGPEHDILTGSSPDGTAAALSRTCQNWTSNSPSDDARVGHHDWSIIPNPITPQQNFNSVHDSPCDEAGMIGVLGSGRLYCFAP